ncbi:MAG: hypothetical protein O3A95_10545 [Planctomycetota bacterium]|nr:hypothetical protein [Planctomycetota bacterium]MDA1114720.1 hypothetical protein [Planctomycetota bacterium]
MKNLLPPSLRIAVCGLAMLLSSSLLAQGSQSLPSGFDTLEGNSSSSFPFNTTSDHKWQWHYDSGQFEMANPILITEVYVRTKSSSSAVTFDFPSVELLMASSPTDYIVGSHDLIFDNNLNSDAVVVRAAAPFTGTAVPAFTWMAFGLDEPFLYDPTLGDDFIFQIRKCGTISTWGASIDGVSGSPGVVGGNRYGHTTDCSAPSQSTSNNEFVPVIKFDWVPTAPSMTVDPMVAGQPTDFNINFMDPGGMVFIRWSLTGPGPTPTIIGDLLLSEPINAAPTVHADASGNLNFTTFIPAGLAGETFYVHTVVQQEGEFILTNALVIPVL